MFCKPITVLYNTSLHQEYYQSLHYNRFFRPPYWRVLLPLCHFRQLSSAGATSLLQLHRLHHIGEWTHCSLQSLRPSCGVRVRHPRPTLRTLHSLPLGSPESRTGQSAPSARNESGQHGRPRRRRTSLPVGGHAAERENQTSGCTALAEGLAPAVKPGPAGRSERRPRRGGRRH